MKASIRESKWSLITEFGIGGSIKLLFLLFALIEYCLYKNMGYYSPSTLSWTNSFFIKISFNFILSINYAAFALTLGQWYYLLFFNSLTWLISCSLLYFEFIRKLQQSWLSLRLYWFINGLYYIAKISYTFYLYINNSKGVISLLYCYLIQSIPSFFLMSFSVFKPSDIDPGSSNIINSNNINNHITASFISNLSPKVKYKTLVTITITEHKSVKYNRKDNMLFPVSVNWTKQENIRLRLKAVFYPNNIYTIKKSLLNIIEFNCLLIEKVEIGNLKKKKCTSVIQLKNLNSFFMKNYKTDCLFKLNELQTIYSNLCQRHSFALIEVIKFFDVLDDQLEKNLLNIFNQLHSGYKHKDRGKDWGNYIKSENEIDNDKNDDIDKVKANSNNNNNQNDFYSEIEDYNYPNANPYSLSYVNSNIITSNNITGMESNDIIKTFNYISSLINKEQMHKLRVLYVNEQPKLSDSEIICNINTEITISITWKNLIILINHNEKINKTPPMLNLKKIVKDANNIINIKKEGNVIRSSIEKIFNEMLNNLMYYDDILFLMFNLNKIIKLDNEEIDMDIIDAFFELEFFYAQNDSDCPYQSFYYSNPKCSIESIKYVTNCNECNNDIALKIRVRIDCSKANKDWDTVICLNEMYKQCNEIILLNASFQRFHSLNYLLEAINQTIKGVIKEYDVIGEGDDNEDSDAYDNIINKDSKEIFLLSNKQYHKKEWYKDVIELNKLMNKLLAIPKNYYIFYTLYFRKAFGINQFSDDDINYLGQGQHQKQCQGQHEGSNPNDENFNDSFSNHNSFYENLI